MVDGLLAGEFDIRVFRGIGTPTAALQTGAPLEFVVSSPHIARFNPGEISAYNEDFKAS
jgi:hypothetical protein